MKLVRTLARCTHYSPYNEPEGFVRSELYVDESLDDEQVDFLLESQKREVLNAPTYKRDYRGEYLPLKASPEDRVRQLELGQTLYLSNGK